MDIVHYFILGLGVSAVIGFTALLFYGINKIPTDDSLF